MNEYSAIAMWVYFTFNYPDPLPMFISIYGDNLGKHIFNKWVGYGCDFNKLFCELTHTNQKMLINYVLNRKGLINPDNYE